MRRTSNYFLSVVVLCLAVPRRGRSSNESRGHVVEGRAGCVVVRARHVRGGLAEASGITWRTRTRAGGEVSAGDCGAGASSSTTTTMAGWTSTSSTAARPILQARDAAKNALYRNNRDGSFTDVTDKANVAGGTFGMGAAAAIMTATAGKTCSSPLTAATCSTATTATARSMTRRPCRHHPPAGQLRDGVDFDNAIARTGSSPASFITRRS